MKTSLRLLLSGVLLLVVQLAMAQTENITGKVADMFDDPLPGANIVQKGTANGTVTNIDGEFKMKLPEGKSVLVIALVGYKTLEMEISVDANGQYQADVLMIKKTPGNKAASKGKVTLKR